MILQLNNTISVIEETLLKGIITHDKATRCLINYFPIYLNDKLPTKELN